MEIFNFSQRDSVYELLSSYYENPILYKIKNINSAQSMYGVQLPCFLLNEKRYLIAITQYDDREQKKHLDSLRWSTLMIRALQDESLQFLPVHNFSIKRDDRYKITLRLKSRAKDITIYEEDSGLFEVSLLHTRNNEFEYPNEGTLVSALETYQTLIYWKK
jgi:hypothetical protein